MKKNVVSLLGIMLIGVILCILLTGCGSNNTKNNDENGGQSSTTTKISKPVTAAETFIKNLIDNKFDEILTFSNITDTTFLTGSDIEWYLPRSNYKGLEDIEEYKKVAGTLVAEQEGMAKIDVSVTEKDGAQSTYSVIVQVNDEQNWVVDLSDFVIKDWTIQATGGNTELSLNNVKVGKKYITGKYGDYKLLNLYVIPFIGKNSVEIKLTAETFGEHILKEVPSANAKNADKYVDAIVEIKDTALESAFNGVKGLWNASYNDYVDGKTTDDALKYFSSDADSEQAKSLWDYYKEIRKATSYQYVEHKITTVISRDDYKCRYYTDSILAMNFKYGLDWRWDWNFGGAENMTRRSNILLKIEDNKYKIYQITDPKLFNYCNHFTKD